MATERDARTDPWPSPAIARPPVQQHQSPPRLRNAVAALLAGASGLVGALLPAFDGQRVGDAESAAFRIGVPLGAIGGLVAVLLAIRVLSRTPSGGLRSAVAVVALVVGVMALLMTATLLFSG